MAKNKGNSKNPSRFLRKVHDRVQRAKTSTTNQGPFVTFRDVRLPKEVVDLLAGITAFANLPLSGMGVTTTIPPSPANISQTPFGYVLAAILDEAMTNAEQEALASQFTPEEINELIEKVFKPTK